MLLVAGDSFAEFPRSTYHYDRGVQGKDNSLANLNNTHWCELWAASLGVASVSTGIPAGDMLTTVSAAQRHILAHTSVSHCVFYVTNPFRTHLPATTSRRKVKRYLKLFANRNHLWHTHDYAQQLTSSHEPVIYPGTHYHTLEANPQFPAEINWTHVWERMDQTTSVDWLNANLNHLAGLAAVAQSRGVKLMFTSGFAHDLLWTSWVESVLKLPVYQYVSPRYADIHCKSHMIASEHAQVFNTLKSQHPKEYAWLASSRH